MDKQDKAPGKDRLERSQKEAICVGIDDGHAEMKLALPDGRLFRIPSKARPGVHGVSVFGRATEGGQIDGGYETDGQRFTVTEHLDGEGTRFDEYPFSALNRVLIHHILRVAGLGGQPVRIATGLPVSHFFQGAGLNMGTIERKSDSVLFKTSALSGAELADIRESHVFSEGVAAWVDYSLDNEGRVVTNVGRPAAVVDIGGRTTDCVTVLPGWRVDHARSGTNNIGVLDLFEAVASRLQSKFGLNEIPQQAIEHAVRTGNLILWNQPNDVSAEVRECKLQIGETIKREVFRRIGKGIDLETVLFVGGGALVFDNLMSHFPNAACPENPQFANARGMLKFMMHVM